MSPNETRLTHNTRRTLRHAACLTASALVAGAATAAAPSDALNFSIAQSFEHDDNLFRLPDGVEPFGGGARDDNISKTSFSALFDRRYSRQNVRASFAIAKVGFDHWSALDYTTRSVSGAWGWSLGSRWRGNLSFTRDEVARDFADVGSAQRETSINQQESFDASANYWWHPDWAVGAGFERYASRYTDDASEQSEYRANIPEFVVTYRPETGNTLALKARFTDGEYPNRIASGTQDEGFRQSDIRLAGRWRLSGLTVLSGYLGLTERKYRNLDVKDFSGPTARLQHDWALSSKVNLRTIVRREIGAREDMTSNFVVTKAVSVSPSWTPTTRIALSGEWEWRERDFGGNPGLVASVTNRDDRSRRLRLRASYLPLDNLDLSLSHVHVSRDSDRQASEYEADVTSLSARFSF